MEQNDSCQTNLPLLEMMPDSLSFTFNQIHPEHGTTQEMITLQFTHSW